MRRSRLRPLALAALAGPLAASCGPAAQAPVGKAAAPAPASTLTRTYKLEGVVRQVSPGTGVVTIRHEAIPGFMAAMTMPFTLKDRAQLDDVAVGDEVEGTLRVETAGGAVKDYELLDLVVSRPAPPAAPVAAAPPPALLRPGDLVPDFALTTQEGKPLRLSDLRGSVVALTFIYTRCPLPDFCPLMDRRFAELAGTIAAVPARAADIRLLSVSFDPEHDTPAVLKAHAESRGARPPLWQFAVASHAELAKVAAPLGLTYGPGGGEIAHNLTTAVIGRDGRLARIVAGRDWRAADLLPTLYALLRAPKG